MTLAGALAGERDVVFTPGNDDDASAQTNSYIIKDGVEVKMSAMSIPSYYEVYLTTQHFTVISRNHLIKKVEFTCLGSDTEQYGPGHITSFTNHTFSSQPQQGTYTYSGTDGKWEGLSQSLTFYVDDIVRFGQITVTYQKDNGDIYDLVTTHDELVENGKYVIVSKYYNKAMSSSGSLYEGEVSAYDKQSVDVEWLDDDKTKVRVNDDAQVITLKNVATYNSTNVSANYSIVDGMLYLRNTSNQIVNTANPYTFYTWLNTTNNHNAIIRGGAASGNIAIRYNATDDKFCFLNYNNSTYERVYLYKQAENFNVNTVCNPAEGGSVSYTAGVVNIDGADKSQLLEVVKFCVNENDGFALIDVTVTDANGAQLEVTAENAYNYYFTMPAGDVTVTLTFSDATTRVADVDAARTVKSVTYCDAAGRMSNRPYNGLNIVVTRYTDGSTSTSKVVR